MSPLAAVTVSGVKTKPSAPTWTVWVADEPEAVVVAAAADVFDEEEAPPPPYCAMAKAGVRRAERKRVDAVKVCMLAGRINWRMSGV
jgi:hypothetical protein